MTGFSGWGKCVFSCRILEENCVCEIELKNNYKMKEQLKKSVYESPHTELFQVMMEGAFMAGSQEAVIKEESTIEVEEYDRFDNEITFE